MLGAVQRLDAGKFSAPRAWEVVEGTFVRPSQRPIEIVTCLRLTHALGPEAEELGPGGSGWVHGQGAEPGYQPQDEAWSKLSGGRAEAEPPARGPGQPLEVGQGAALGVRLCPCRCWLNGSRSRKSWSPGLNPHFRGYLPSVSAGKPTFSTSVLAGTESLMSPPPLYLRNHDTPFPWMGVETLSCKSDSQKERKRV